jgi:tetratricopeptide (TPR) repeat protein
MIYLSYILLSCFLLLFSSCTAHEIPPWAFEHYLEGKKLYIQGDIDASLQQFTAARRQAPHFSQNSYMLAKAYYFSRDYRRAEEIWRETVKRNPRHTDSRKWLARLCLQQGRGQAAAELVGAALENNSEDPELLLLLARAKAVDGEYDEAIQLYQRAQIFEQRLAEARIALAEIYQRFGLKEQAFSELMRAEILMSETNPLHEALEALLKASRGDAP